LHKVYTLDNPKDHSQHMIFFSFYGSPNLIKATYQMGFAVSPHIQILVKATNNLDLQMFHSQCYDLQIDDARAVWNYLTEVLTWTIQPPLPTKSIS
jgi:hypothetical protein